MVVVWSTASVNSEYVRSEAEDAADRNILVPVLIDNVKPPLAHRRRQAAILTDSFDGRDSEYRKLSAGIRAVLGNSTSAPTRDTSAPRFTRSRKFAWILPIVLLLPLMAGAIVQRDAIMTSLILNFPALFFGEPIKQEIGFTTTQDGVRIAYAKSGAGFPIVQVLSVGTHIESGQFSPVYDNEGLLRMSSKDNLFLRYDGRGTGLSQRGINDFSLDARLRDLESVVEASGLQRFGILAVSAGGQVAIAYTSLNPERVTRLVLAGALSTYQSDENAVISNQLLDLIRVGWQRPEVPRMLADMLLGPSGTETQRQVVGEMLQRANTGADLSAFYRASADIDVRDYARKIAVPTLVIQARDDNMVPPDEGRAQAALIPDARLEIVDGGHMASSASTAATRRLALEFLSTPAR